MSDIVPLSRIVRALTGRLQQHGEELVRLPPVVHWHKPEEACRGVWSSWMSSLRPVWLLYRAGPSARPCVVLGFCNPSMRATRWRMLVNENIVVVPAACVMAWTEVVEPGAPAQL